MIISKKKFDQKVREAIEREERERWVHEKIERVERECNIRIDNIGRSLCELEKQIVELKEMHGGCK